MMWIFVLEEEDGTCDSQSKIGEALQDDEEEGDEERRTNNVIASRKFGIDTHTSSTLGQNVENPKDENNKHG